MQSGTHIQDVVVYLGQNQGSAVESLLCLIERAVLVAALSVMIVKTDGTKEFLISKRKPLTTLSRRPLVTTQVYLFWATRIRESVDSLDIYHGALYPSHILA